MTVSALTLSTLRARVQNLLVDAGAVVWSTDTLDEGIRQAISDLGRALGAKPTLKDLGGATGTTIDDRDEDLLIRGAAGYAARSRAADRSDMVNLAVGSVNPVFEWGKNQIYWFMDELKKVRARGFQASASSPHSALTWDESDKNW